jgi:TPP-dependent indolepyruvate ferredoxin oxidoreductase alpha subunit
MLQGMVVKVIINQVMKAIEKADDKKIASNHEKRIKKLEKTSHPRRNFVCCECCKNKIKEK